MEDEFHANELRTYMLVQTELRDALKREDKETARLALEELLALGEYSTWPRLRARCEATVAEFQ